jgi:signal transduction histidine kinase
VASGALSSRVPISQTHAVEVRSLAESFNHMLQSLAEEEATRQRLTADIAHELRTPISVMRSQLQAMLDGVSLTDAEHVAIVFDQVLHLTRLVDDMRLLTQAEAGQLALERRLIAPAALLEQAQTLFEPLAQDAELTLASTCDPDLPDVFGDPDRLQQVLANLVTNSLRHTEPGGTITLSAVSSESGVVFTVANSGVTLTPEQAKHVFDRFWRADEARSRDRGGAGLGLAISRQIVQLHGGTMRVEVDSETTRFLFDLPVASS